MIKQAVESAGSTAPKDIRDALETVENAQGLTTPITIRKDHKVIRSAIIFRVMLRSSRRSIPTWLITVTDVNSLTATKRRSSSQLKKPAFLNERRRYSHVFAAADHRPVCWKHLCANGGRLFMIYSLLNFTNFAHGASVLIGAYVGYFYISSVADNVLMAVVCSTFFGAVLAALIERIAYQPLLNKGVKRIYLLIAGLGISIIGENLIVVMIDGRFHAYKTSLSAMPVSILGASIGVVDLIILVASAIALLSVRS